MNPCSNQMTTCYSNQKQYSSICKCRLPQSQQTRLSIQYLRRDLRNKAYKPTSFYWRIVVKLGAPAWNVSSRRNGRDPPRDLHETRDVFGRDRDETRDAEVRDRDETETFGILVETRPRREIDTSRDRLETETSRPRPHPWKFVKIWRTWNAFYGNLIYAIQSIN